MECEPPAPGTAPIPSMSVVMGSGAAPRRHRMPSPSPSSISSHSNQSGDQKQKLMYNMPKFGERFISIVNHKRLFLFSGVESPQAVQKMLSLVQNSKVKTQGGQPQFSQPINILAPRPQLSQSAMQASKPPPSSTTHFHQSQNIRRNPSFNTPEVPSSSADLPPLGMFITSIL